MPIKTKQFAILITSALPLFLYGVIISGGYLELYKQGVLYTTCCAYIVANIPAPCQVGWQGAQRRLPVPPLFLYEWRRTNSSKCNVLSWLWHHRKGGLEVGLRGQLIKSYSDPLWGKSYRDDFAAAKVSSEQELKYFCSKAICKQVIKV